MKTVAEHHFGEFTIRRLIARGGMGEVYEAFQASLRRTVALKILPPWLADDPESCERFQDEATITAKLDHPHILPIYSFGNLDNRYYFAMKLVRGMSLGEMLRRWRKIRDTSSAPTADWRGTQLETMSNPAGTTEPAAVSSIAQRMLSPLPHSLTSDDLGAMQSVCEQFWHDRVAFARRVGIAVAQALAYAHGQDLIHRDVKPSNILIDKHGHIYLIDFGITRVMGADVTNHRSGTPRYMSPEQIDMSPLSGLTDVYSLGATLYELVAGEHPYSEVDEPSKLAARIRSGSFEPLRSIAPSAPIELCRLIERALSKEPADRLNARELAEQLQRLDAATDIETKNLSEKFARSAWKRYLAFGVAAAVLAIAFVTHSAFSPGRAKNGRRPESSRRDSAGEVPKERKQIAPRRPIAAISRARVLQTLPLAGATELEHDDPTGNGYWQHLAERSELLVVSTGFILLGLAEVNSANYSFRLGVRQNNWGGSGLFFGYHDAELPDGRSARKFQLLRLIKQNNQLRLQRSVAVATTSPNGTPSLHHYDVVSAPVTTAGTAEHTLAIYVQQGRLQKVVWNGDPLPQLTGDRVDADITETNFLGGGYTVSGALGPYGGPLTQSFFRSAEIQVNSL